MYMYNYSKSHCTCSVSHFCKLNVKCSYLMLDLKINLLSFNHYSKHLMSLLIKELYSSSCNSNFRHELLQNVYFFYRFKSPGFGDGACGSRKMFAHLRTPVPGLAGLRQSVGGYKPSTSQRPSNMHACLPL